MIQAQRDYFGAHTFERVDGLRGQFFHETGQDTAEKRSREPITCSLSLV